MQNAFKTAYFSSPSCALRYFCHDSQVLVTRREVHEDLLILRKRRGKFPSCRLARGSSRRRDDPFNVAELLEGVIASSSVMPIAPRARLIFREIAVLRTDSG